MDELNTTIFNIERRISLVSIRVNQLQRVIDGLRGALINALTVFADLLRDEYQLEQQRAQLLNRLSACRFDDKPEVS